MRVRLNPLALSAIALLLAALPYIAGFAAAPRGTVFLGALNNVGDTGQYLAAIRQGMDATTGVGRLLYVDQYSSLRAAPVLMYPFYTVAGVVFSPFHPPVMAVYQLLHVLAAVALLGALWRFCRAVSPGASPVLPYALALFGGGLYAPALLLSGVVRLPIAPVALTAPELSIFATLLISPHGAAGLAAQLWALAGYLRWRRYGRARDLSALALGGLALGLCYPFGIVVLVAVVAVDIVMSPHPPALSPSRGEGEARPIAGLARRSTPPRPRVGRGALDRRPQPRGQLAMRRGVRASLALLPACGIALYYAVLFHHDPLWSGSAMLRPPPPNVALLVGAFGPLALLAAPTLRALVRGGYPRLVHYRLATSPLGPPRSPRPACAATRSGVPDRCAPDSVPWRPQAARSAAQWIDWRRALGISVPNNSRSLGGYRGAEETGIRLAATWALATPLLLLAPLPQTERLLSGWSVALAVLGALTLRRLRPRAAGRVVIILGCSNVMLALLYLAVALHGANPAYYAPVSEARAAGWLAAHSGPDDVVMASAGSGNLIVSVAACHVVVGQNFETFDWAAAQRDVLRFYNATTTVAARAAIMRRQRVTLVMDGSYEAALGRYAPGHRGYRMVYQDGPVRVFAVTGTEG